MIGRLMIRVIGWYQRHISPQLGSRCKYLPSCSQYSNRAIEALRPAARRSEIRLADLRCNPFSKGGYDRLVDLSNLYT